MTLLYTESGPNDYSRAFAAITRGRPDAMYLPPIPYLLADRHRLIEFATANRLPLMGQNRTVTEAGALISYSGNLTDYWARTASYVDRILQGVKPADLPIERIATFELVVNMKTARALGLTVSRSVLLRADHVIE